MAHIHSRHQLQVFHLDVFREFRKSLCAPRPCALPINEAPEWLDNFLTAFPEDVTTIVCDMTDQGCRNFYHDSDRGTNNLITIATDYFEGSVFWDTFFALADEEQSERIEKREKEAVLVVGADGGVMVDDMSKHPDLAVKFKALYPKDDRKA